LHQTKNHRIWIGTFDQGLLCYHPKNKAIKQYTESSGLINNNILSLESRGDTLWIASLGDVSRDIQSNNQLRFQSFDQTNDSGTNYVYHLFKESKIASGWELMGRACSILKMAISKGHSRIRWPIILFTLLQKLLMVVSGLQHPTMEFIASRTIN
jgi:ligand-binding sensor domain-containing protein